MTEFIAPFSFVNAEISDIEDLYNPDFTVQRKPNSHTMRKCMPREPCEYIVKIDRPMCDDGIPVTEMDEYLDNRAFIQSQYHPTEISLHKKGKYDQFIYAIEECCVEKTMTYDKQTNSNKTKYKVPAIGVLVDYETPRFYSKTYDVSETDKKTQKFIIVRGKLYSVNKYYREVGLDYSEIHLSENYFHTNVPHADDETVYATSKVNFSKGNLTYSFHHDMKISSILVRPELMKFKKVHSDNSASRYDRKNPDILRKQMHYINVLDNDPGFLSKFEMFYRSDNTNGQWVKHGVYNGNVSIADSTKISFDEIMAKEIRIVPLSFHKSYEHTRVNFIGKCKVKPKSEDIFVTYEVSTPRDGKYMNASSKISDCNVKYTESRDWKKFMMENKMRYDRKELFRRVNMYDY